MKNINNINNRYLQGLLMGLCAIIALSLSSCNRTLDTIAPSDDMISFDAETGYENDVATRTEYSGVDENGQIISSSSQYERINWVTKTDLVRILCAQALDEAGSPNTSGTLMVAPGNRQNPSPVNSGRFSTAAIIPIEGTKRFFWGEGMHYFYGLYPAAGTVSKYDEEAVVTDSDSKIEALEGNKALITGSIPAAQTCVKKDTIFKPNMNLAYMYTAKKTPRPANDKVSLTFHPLVTSFEFSLKALDDAMAGADLLSVKLSSTSTDLTGGFTTTLDIDGTTPVDFEKTGTSGREITITLPTGTRLSKTQYSVVTFIALGVEQTNLTLTLNFDGGLSRSLALTKTVDGATTPVTVGAYKKAYFKLDVPGSTTVTYYIDPLVDVTLTHVGGSAQLSQNNPFESYKTINGTTHEAVPYKLMYSMDNGATWKDEAPGWCPTPIRTRANAESTGDGKAIYVRMNPQDNSGEDPHGDILKARTAKENFDLSTLNVATGATVQTNTANCYVIDAPGTYKFPIVYGNGIKNGDVNPAAYTYQGNYFDVAPDESYYYNEDGSPVILPTLKDHLDQDITSPYIAVQHSGKAMDAVVIWSDYYGLVKNPLIDGTGASAYLTFEVPVDRICQGNALLGVRVDDDGDGTPETIAWSWHIWVTDETVNENILGFKPATNIGYGRNPTPDTFSNMSLGWVTGKTEVYVTRSFKVKAVQLEPATGALESEPVTVTQLDYQVITLGNNVYYQFGRKDPMPACVGTGDYFREYYSDDPNTLPAMSETRVSLGEAIQHPYRRYFGQINGDVLKASWVSPAGGNSNNLWNNGLRYQSDAQYGLVLEGGASLGRFDRTQQAKTIYDPCPVGYKVPSLYAVSGALYVYDNTLEAATESLPARVALASGLYFPLLGRLGNIGASEYYATFDEIGSEAWFWTDQSVTTGEANMLNVNSDMLVSTTSNSTVSMGRQISASVKPVLDDYNYGD